MEQGSNAMGLQRIRVHDFRVSLLIHMGYSAVAIAERMGHESIDITFRYLLDNEGYTCDKIT